MSHRTRMGLYLESDSDFKMIAADLKNIVDLDEVNEKQRFLHWETTQGHDIETFGYLVRKYPNLVCHGYSENEAMWMGRDTGHLDIRINKGRMDIEESGCGDNGIFDDEDFEEEDEEEIAKRITEDYVTVDGRVIHPKNTESTEQSKTSYWPKIEAKDNSEKYLVYAYNKEYDIGHMFYKTLDKAEALRTAEMLLNNIGLLQLWCQNMKTLEDYHVRADDIRVYKEHISLDEVKVLTKPKIRAPF